MDSLFVLLFTEKINFTFVEVCLPGLKGVSETPKYFYAILLWADLFMNHETAKTLIKMSKNGFDKQ
jgi:hypothetical protein